MLYFIKQNVLRHKIKHYISLRKALYANYSLHPPKEITCVTKTFGREERKYLFC